MCLPSLMRCLQVRNYSSAFFFLVEETVHLLIEPLGYQLFMLHCWRLPLFSANPKRAALFYDQSLSTEDIYEPFLS